MEHGRSRLTFPLPCLQLIVVEMAQKPKRKGKGLQTFLVVQFHPAPPPIPSPAIWKVPWYQDVTITVQKRIETEGFGPWSMKADVLHVQLPSDPVCSLTRRLFGTL
jgi:hypothetical protein